LRRPSSSHFYFGRNHPHTVDHHISQPQIRSQGG
jgi:hypothetical protein